MQQQQQQPNREHQLHPAANMAHQHQQQHHQQPQQTAFYEMGSPADSLQPINPDSLPQGAHLHPIGLCAVPANVQHQLGEILPGTVFADPAMGHLHYHIYPSRRALEPGTMQSYRGHPRLEPVHHQHELVHYQRQSPRIRPTPDDRFDRAEKNKGGIPMMDLGSDSQSSKSKCQCHTLHQHQQHQHQMRAIKRDSDNNSEDEGGPGRQPPALPPRPPPRPSGRRYELPSTATTERRHAGSGGHGSGSGCCKKYVVLCCLCGGLSAAVGTLFLAVHAVLSAHTASLALFETVPSYIPGTMLIFMGLFTMLLARRKHRYGFLMKVCGSISVVCALVCVLVTVTTTVVHMSRLQGLRECVYTARAKSCTCYGAPQSRASDPGVLFEGTPHCEAVHGALYACLRALFGVSVAGILACIFSCMLVYQLLSHEKKKMYWEQLELRCRSLYGQGPSANLVGGRPVGTCGCCNDCGGIGPWWAQSPGNLYTPNPDMTPARRWRLPWSRSRGPAPSAADTNYGFQNSGGNQHQDALMEMPNGIMPYGIALHHPQSGPAGAYSVLQAAARDDPYGQNGATGYSVLDAAVPLWGPPPPYSDPNSPARRPMIAFPGTERTRLSKRIDTFPLREAVEYGRSAEIKRPNANYENAEQISNETDSTEPSDNNEVRASRNNKHKKMLKGVENAGFNPNEVNPKPQSESELYFGDVSSCCGPESSLYDVATDKEAKPQCHREAAEAGTSYLNSHFPKRLSSRRSRRSQHNHQSSSSSSHQPDLELIDMPVNNQTSSSSNSSSSSSNDEQQQNNKPGSSYTNAEVEYEVIRQSRYGSPERYPEKAQPQVEQALVERQDEDSEDEEVLKTLETEEEERKRKMYEDEVRPVNV